MAILMLKWCAMAGTAKRHQASLYFLGSDLR
jgi:hypothetical protein